MLAEHETNWEGEKEKAKRDSLQTRQNCIKGEQQHSSALHANDTGHETQRHTHTHTHTYTDKDKDKATHNNPDATNRIKVTNGGFHSATKKAQLRDRLACIEYRYRSRCCTTDAWECVPQWRTAAETAQQHHSGLPRHPCIATSQRHDPQQLFDKKIFLKEHPVNDGAKALCASHSSDCGEGKDGRPSTPPPHRDVWHEVHLRCGLRRGLRLVFCVLLDTPAFSLGTVDTLDGSPDGVCSDSMDRSDAVGGGRMRPLLAGR